MKKISIEELSHYPVKTRRGSEPMYAKLKSELDSLGLHEIGVVYLNEIDFKDETATLEKKMGRLWAIVAGHGSKSGKKFMTKTLKTEDGVLVTRIK